MQHDIRLSIGGRVLDPKDYAPAHFSTRRRPRKPRLGEWSRQSNGQYRVYTMRGWILVDTRAEVDEELSDIASMVKGGER